MRVDKSGGFLLDFIILGVSIALNSVYHILFETPKFEVPQTSVLSSLLFSLFTSSLGYLRYVVHFIYHLNTDDS